MAFGITPNTDAQQSIYAGTKQDSFNTRLRHNISLSSTVGLITGGLPGFTAGLPIGFVVTISQMGSQKLISFFGKERASHIASAYIGDGLGIGLNFAANYLIDPATATAKSFTASLLAYISGRGMQKGTKLCLAYYKISNDSIWRELAVMSAGVAGAASGALFVYFTASIINGLMQSETTEEIVERMFELRQVDNITKEDVEKMVQSAERIAESGEWEALIDDSNFSNETTELPPKPTDSPDGKRFYGAFALAPIVLVLALFCMCNGGSRSRSGYQSIS
ncbi:hypothetical protein D5R81_13035 [Parashewanella spongiae]|uniref:Uncharacterized protein n=2 Tax=Parashewanella spongiae TaxID=342950 RepID=A0A3A6TS85_9GAMM|nr:hypothetical protein [Parashewanella spongiae]RJY11475.1 hypothetical protein D5R81_13035 [Parashewanella spongiae]